MSKKNELKYLLYNLNNYDYDEEDLADEEELLDDFNEDEEW